MKKSNNSYYTDRSLSKKKQGHRKTFRFRFRSLMLAGIFMLALILGIVLLTAGVTCAGENNPPRTYESRLIENGDTLWAIASEYSDEEKDIRACVSEIKRLNNLSGDTIHVGHYLLVPVESEDF